MAEMDYTRLMQALGGGPGTSVRQSPGMTREKAQTLAFQTEMQMAMRLFGGGEEESASAGFGNAMGSDALLMDALSTLSRLMKERPGAGGQAVNVVRATVPRPAIQSAVVDGALSAMFESGAKGVEAVGYDRVGGTSYGKYQIASRTGTMERFLDYLDEQAPEWAERLREAGPANTGGRGGAMPREWKAIAAESPERFERLQREFIRQDHYQPAREKILAQTGLDVDNLPLAAQEVLWSTAVQHGPTGAASIFGNVIESLNAENGDGEFVRGLIDHVYDERKTQFGSSTSRVRRSVQSRMEREKEMALSMLSPGGLNRLV